MTPQLLLITFLVYTILLFLVTYITSKKASNRSYFIGNKNSPWFIVAYGMIGTLLSGVTFMSVPGQVGSRNFAYLMVVFGYFAGYAIIANVLIPLYYRLNLTSIYTYLKVRFGNSSYKTGSFFFILSRSLGAAFRMFLVINVLQIFIFKQWNMPFPITVLIFISLIILYTLKGGIKTIIWTDTLQTTFMLLALIITIFIISNQLNLNLFELIEKVWDSPKSKIFVTDWHSEWHFLKQFLSGVFIAIVMTGLDQEMMQKNLSIKNVKNAKKNIYTFSFAIVIVNIIFLFLGAALLMYAEKFSVQIPALSDELFPVIAIHHLGWFSGLVFFIGLISAAFPSADGALTSLTTSFTMDILGYSGEGNKQIPIYKRKIIHIAFAFLLFAIITIFQKINDRAIIENIFSVAGYTYGPLLGLYAFGLFTKKSVVDKWVPIVAVVSPVICFFLSRYSKELFWGYKFGFELLIINGLITFLGLYLLSIKKKKS